MSVSGQYGRLVTSCDNTRCRRGGKVNRTPQNGDEGENKRESVTNHVTARLFHNCVFYKVHHMIASDMAIYNLPRDTA